ncbi:MAG: UDP-glucose/GDP-mannose dehydrogenase family protein [Nitrososphaerota archaeon]|nr:UDP-glucose/GDP-mannose dehydrogenase family protein [Nitrososphaerota archaeon]
MSSYRVSFFGLGYVGLTMAACFASKGFMVTGYDVDKGRIRSLKAGRTPMFEPGVGELIAKAGGLLRATDDPAEAVSGADFIFITTGTPSRSDGSIDTGYVESAARTIGEMLKGSNRYAVIVVKSTVVPGTTAGPVREELERGSGLAAGKGFGLVMNPEFLKEGHAVDDMFRPDRLVIGEVDRRSGDSILGLYDEFYDDHLPPVLRTTTANAELIKYANNSFLAIKIGFANSMARLCQTIPGGDVDVVMKGIGMDSRIGPEFLRAGVAWGGSCFPKDLKAIRAFAEGRGVKLGLVDASLEANDNGPLEMVAACERAIGGLEGKAVAILGLSFKPDTDDTRESPAIRMGLEFIRKGATVRAFDPAVKQAPSGFTIYGDPLDCIQGADLAVLATEWKAIQEIRPAAFKERMRNAVVMDTRRVYDRSSFRAAGVRLLQLGRDEGY